MKKYSEYEAMFPVVEVEPAKYEYWAYKGGEVKKCDTRAEAEEFSRMIERNLVNEDARKKQRSDTLTRSMNVRQTWCNDLMEESPELVRAKIFEKVLTMANDYDIGDNDSIAEFVFDFNQLLLIAKQTYTSQ